MARLSGPHAGYQIPPLPPTKQELFWSKVDRSGGPDSCWLWTAGKFTAGYGAFGHGGTMEYAHRIALFLELGELPTQKLVRHMCHNRACVNPAHLKVGTQLENMNDPGGRTNALKTHCPKGHPYDEENTYRTGRGRQCRACTRESAKGTYDPEKSRDYMREYMRAYRARKKASSQG